MKEPTIRQEWARERNRNIGRLKGIINNLNYCAKLKSTTQGEQFHINLAINQLQDILDHHRYSRGLSWHQFKEEQ